MLLLLLPYWKPYCTHVKKRMYKKYVQSLYLPFFLYTLTSFSQERSSQFFFTKELDQYQSHRTLLLKLFEFPPVKGRIDSARLPDLDEQTDGTARSYPNQRTQTRVLLGSISISLFCNKALSKLSAVVQTNRQATSRSQHSSSTTFPIPSNVSPTSSNLSTWPSSIFRPALLLEMSPPLSSALPSLHLNPPSRPLPIHYTRAVQIQRTAVCY